MKWSKTALKSSVSILMIHIVGWTVIEVVLYYCIQFMLILAIQWSHTYNSRLQEVLQPKQCQFNNHLCQKMHFPPDALTNECVKDMAFHIDIGVPLNNVLFSKTVLLSSTLFGMTVLQNSFNVGSISCNTQLLDWPSCYKCSLLHIQVLHSDWFWLKCRRNYSSPTNETSIRFW